MKWGHTVVLALQGALYLAVVIKAPYTKVEESFSLHAVHDILNYGVFNVSGYDHMTFPGAVPRSFIGPLILSGLAYVPVKVGWYFGIWTRNLDVQILVRCILAAINLACASFMYRKLTPWSSVPMALVQFHLAFYAGRTLPNFFAMPPVCVSMAWIYSGRPYAGFSLLTAAATVFRLELVALFLPLAFVFVAQRGFKVRVLKLVCTCTVSALVSLAMTVCIDSHFWQYWVWPEGYAAAYNVVEGHASEWGVTPPGYYFYNGLPKLGSLTLPFVFLSRRYALWVPALLFVGLMSLLAHKEWRFIVYVVPLLNACVPSGIETAADLAHRIVPWVRRSVYKGAAVFALVLGMLILSIFPIAASVHNYPGGEAMAWLSDAQFNESILTLHIDPATAMMGASKFAEPCPETGPWWAEPCNGTKFIIDKNESEELNFDLYDLVATEKEEPPSGYVLIEKRKAFERVRGVSLEMRDAIFVYKKN